MAKKILRIIWMFSAVFHWFLFGCLIMCVINGANNFLITIALSLYGVEIFFGIKNAISKRNRYRNMYKKYQEMFENLKYIHSSRYGLYFSGDVEQVEYITKSFNECAAEQLEVGKLLLENPNVTQEEKAGVQEIMNKTNQLLNNIQPPM